MKVRTKYYLTSVLSLSGALLLILLSGFYSSESLHEKFRILADAFTLPAIILISLFLLLRISSSGFFDIFGYGASRLSSVLIPKKPREHEAYLDYKARVAVKRHTSYKFLLYTGAFFLVISLIFIILFYKSV